MNVITASYFGASRAGLLEVLERTPAAPLCRRAAIDEVHEQLAAAGLPALEVRRVELPSSADRDSPHRTAR